MGYLPHSSYLPGEHECEWLNLITCPVDKTQSFNKASYWEGHWGTFWHVWVEFSSSQIFLLESWIAPAAYGKNIIYSIRHHWWETNLNHLLAEIDDFEATQILLGTIKVKMFLHNATKTTLNWKIIWKKNASFLLRIPRRHLGMCLWRSEIIYAVIV